MPWQEVSTVSLRTEFVQMAGSQAIPFAELCRRFQISRKTGYKWLRRFQQEALPGLADRSRRPQHSPARLSPAVEAQIVALRDRHPQWGAAKLRVRLPGPQLPSTSTINRVLRRTGRLDPAESGHHQAWHRFEHPQPNDLWQMDFKGWFELSAEPRSRCHPLTVLDDHSRFALGLVACANQQTATVQAVLTDLFRRYGLPAWMTMDNGAPWGTGGQGEYTPLTVWLLRLGVGCSHSHPYHPQTQGKAERFHRTLNTELLRQHTFSDLAAVQAALDHWRTEYNHERPHQALGLHVPASQYWPSPRPFPEVLPPLEYGPEDDVRKVQAQGEVHFRGRIFRVSKAFRGQRVGWRPTAEDGVWELYFGSQCIATVNWDDGLPAD